ncbi:hypothetical protein Pse7367_0021 [Thalassoporum mexicanum PCC 7367]|uniref:hypothetical protein n=1 Tax=Thalassoporum mexicanum TaxID=3457544 RepID=UPI00029F8889|nr:hypothetical protein [Pseudanabaena sp. PCC 7367]AFY68342.1 hypothetical protein Pse7367_0021 [Pseudanabaena sp. PCC 7367]
MENLEYIDILYLVLPIIFGALLSLIGIQKKYLATTKYILNLWQVWIYLALSAFGSLLVTSTLRYVGTTVIGHSELDCIFMSLIGAGSFIGIITQIPIPGSDNNDISKQLKTIRDFVYEFFDASIEQKVRQIIQTKLKSFNLGRQFSVDGEYLKDEKDNSFLREVSRLLRGTNLPEGTIRDWEREFDIYVAVRGDYASVIKVLVKYYDLDYLLYELSDFLEETPASNEPVADKAESSTVLRKNWLHIFWQSNYKWAVNFLFLFGLGLLIFETMNIIGRRFKAYLPAIALNFNMPLVLGLVLIAAGILAAFFLYRRSK